jgi:hypothetical protein
LSSHAFVHWFQHRFLRHFNVRTPIVVNGEAGFVPTPILLYITAAITLLSIIPILLIKQDRPVKQPQAEIE